MFDSIHIHRFRGIRQCNISDFARVNLFFGKNNCGKSSVLEALFLLSGQSNPTLPIALNGIRGIKNKTFDSLAVNFYRADTSTPISLSATGPDARSLEIKMTRRSNVTVNLEAVSTTDTEAEGVTSLDFSYRIPGHTDEYTSSLIIDQDKPNEGLQHVDPRYKEAILCRFLSSRVPTAVESDHYAEVIRKKEEEFIYDILRIVEPGLVDIQLVGKEFLVNLGGECRLPVNVMGDGFVKIFNLILSIYYTANGIVIVDELDSGIHYSIMPHLWEAVFEVCRRRNVQLFATTHSLDLIKALVKACEKTEADDVAAYKLIRKPDDEVVALRYTAAQLKYSINQEIEMR